MVTARIGQSCALAAANGASRSASAAPIAFSIQLGPLAPPLAGEGWGGGDLKLLFILKPSLGGRAPSLSLQPKSDVSDFGQLIARSNSGKPEFDCKRERGRSGAAHRNSAGRDSEHAPANSVRADAGLADGLGPAFDLLRQELGKIFGAAALRRHDLEAELLEPLADRRIVKHIAHRLVELAHDRLRRSFREAEGVPHARLDARQALLARGREIGINR